MAKSKSKTKKSKRVSSARAQSSAGQVVVSTTMDSGIDDHDASLLSSSSLQFDSLSVTTTSHTEEDTYATANSTTASSTGMSSSRSTSPSNSSILTPTSLQMQPSTDSLTDMASIEDDNGDNISSTVVEIETTRTTDATALSRSEKNTKKGTRSKKGPTTTSSLSNHHKEVVVMQQQPSILSLQQQQQQHSRRYSWFLRALLWTLVVVLTTCTLLYGCSACFRRSVLFWKQVLPMILQYKWIQFHAQYVLGYGTDENQINPVLLQYHEANAPHVLNMVLSLGGIYIKLGQVISTMGIGLFPDPYVQILRTLQDGVPPRSYGDIATIIESTTSRTMSELFVEFDPVPLGAASIAQVHRAVLRSTDNSEQQPQQGEEVVVKVQYPDVAELFEIDFYNAKLVVQIIHPQHLHVLQSLRERHEMELDFTIEAHNLHMIRANMHNTKNRIEPNMVRIPVVKNETGLCTKNMIVMEYLRGISLKQVIAQEQQSLAKALGMVDANALRQAIVSQLRSSSSATTMDAQDGTVVVSSASAVSGLQPPTRKIQLFLLSVGPIAIHTLRIWMSIQQQIQHVVRNVHHIWDNIRQWHGEIMGHKKTNDKSTTIPPLHQQPPQVAVNLGQVLKTLIYVHGWQLLNDGVFNVDPHPGNVLILPDGRLGLLDYGMVGRITDEERLRVAQLVVAFTSRNRTEVVRLYNSSGYQLSWKNGRTIIGDTNILHRFASLNLDRLDLSPIVMLQHHHSGKGRERMDIVSLLGSVVETHLPLWIEKSRRMGTLLLGAASQAARPMSLSHEWRDIAQRVIATAAQPTNAASSMQ